MSEKSNPEIPLEAQTSLMVVDDDPDILRIVNFYLTKQKYTVFTASDGGEALKRLHEHPEVELILSDVMMPKVSGLELVRSVRSDPLFKDIPIILISAQGETSQKVEGLNLGADDYITKPFNFDELMARVRNHLRLRRLQKELKETNDQLTTRNDQFVKDLEAARAVQMALMPSVFPESEHYALAAKYFPVETVGGDFFDVVSLEGGKKMGLFIADVCGHGVAAAFVTAMTKIAFRNACFNIPDPREVLADMNAHLHNSLEGTYVTVFYGVLDVETKQFSYASGGHPPLLVHRRETGEMLELKAQATFLGFFEDVDFKSESVNLQSGDRVLFYTDGLFESQNKKNEQFSYERMMQIPLDFPNMSIDELLGEMIENMLKFVEGLPLDDDITLLGLDVLS